MQNSGAIAASLCKIGAGEVVQLGIGGQFFVKKMPLKIDTLPGQDMG